MIKVKATAACDECNATCDIVLGIIRNENSISDKDGNLLDQVISADFDVSSVPVGWYISFDGIFGIRAFCPEHKGVRR